MENLNPIEYGKLLAKVEGLESKVNSMDADIKTLLALANQSKGGFWMGMTIASIVGGILAWFAQHWMK
jgi:hypothetical protein